MKDLTIAVLSSGGQVLSKSVSPHLLTLTHWHSWTAGAPVHALEQLINILATQAIGCDVHSVHKLCHSPALLPRPHIFIWLDGSLGTDAAALARCGATSLFHGDIRFVQSRGQPNILNIALSPAGWLQMFTDLVEDSHRRIACELQLDTLMLMALNARAR